MILSLDLQFRLSDKKQAHLQLFVNCPPRKVCGPFAPDTLPRCVVGLPPTHCQGVWSICPRHIASSICPRHIAKVCGRFAPDTLSRCVVELRAWRTIHVSQHPYGGNINCWRGGRCLSKFLMTELVLIYIYIYIYISVIQKRSGYDILISTPNPHWYYPPQR